MELQSIIDTTLQSFDFSFCIIVNLLTYTIIKISDDLNGDKPLSIWIKRLILLISIITISTLWYIHGKDTTLILNSAILAPVFWSWIMKPICNKLGVDYKQIVD